MSQINKITIGGLFLLAGMSILTGCGSSQSNPVFNTDNGTHPANWLWAGHAAAAKADVTVCEDCHGVDLSGGIEGIACSDCHVNGSPLTQTDCTSCHGSPPNGTVAPNRAGAHNTTDGHFAAQVTLPDGCNTCHNGAGTGTPLHDNGVVDVQFLSIYSAKSGTAVYNVADGTCSNVSCHGGQTTPPWLTGTINVSTQCTSCHALGTSEYNSFISGQHYFHVVLQGLNCNFCHDVVKLSVSHFTTLNTPTIQAPASATIEDYVNFNPATLTCTPGCHETRVW